MARSPAYGSRRIERGERCIRLPLAALAAAITLSLAPAAAEAHHCKNRSCAELKPRYRACDRFTDTSREARCEIRRAAVHYRQPVGDALRVAWCESRLRWWLTGHHEGMWQFAWSTWSTTPYASRSPHSAKWASLAAMWMWSVGRRSEWECK